MLDDAGLKSRERFVLVAIALRAGSDGRSWPSVARLSADTGYGRSTVLFALQNLVDTGHLEVIHRAGRSSVLTDPGVCRFCRGTPADTGPRGSAICSQNPSRYRTQRSKEEVDKKYAARTHP